jgi:hypothetical protein
MNVVLRNSIRAGRKNRLENAKARWHIAGKQALLTVQWCSFVFVAFARPWNYGHFSFKALCWRKKRPKQALVFSLQYIWR